MCWSLVITITMQCFHNFIISFSKKIQHTSNKGCDPPWIWCQQLPGRSCSSHPSTLRAPHCFSCLIPVESGWTPFANPPSNFRDRKGGSKGKGASNELGPGHKVLYSPNNFAARLQGLAKLDGPWPFSHFLKAVIYMVFCCLCCPTKTRFQKRQCHLDDLARKNRCLSAVCHQWDVLPSKIAVLLSPPKASMAHKIVCRNLT